MNKLEQIRERFIKRIVQRHLLDQFKFKVKDQWQLFQDSLAKWSDSTFGSNRPPELTFSHLEEEVEELKADPFDIMEYADCFILLIDCARRAGYSMNDLHAACNQKLEKCKKRQWGPPDETGKCSHIPGIYD